MTFRKVRRHYCTINAKLKLAEWDADKKRSVLTPSKTRKRSQARIVKKKNIKAYPNVSGEKR